MTESDPLDRLIQIIEISFIFLLSFTIIALVDAAFEGLNLYRPLATNYLGAPEVGDLRGGNFEEIVRITFILNGLLFISSLIFGVWIRKTRDGWTWSDLGYTLHTENYSFKELVLRGILLGIIAILIFYAVMTGMFYLEFGSEGFLSIFAYSNGDRLFTPKELNASYYFGIVEMGFIWPLSAGFFFFSYAYNSLKSRFPLAISNLLATAFYVFYLIFFFLIPQREKVSMFYRILFSPDSIPGFSPYLFWGQVVVFLIILYINFSSFEQTGSIVLPFLMNFVFNVGLTLLRAGNTLAFKNLDLLMILPVLGLGAVVVVWYLIRNDHFSTLRIAASQLKDIRGISWKEFLVSLTIFVMLAFIFPGIIYELLFINNTSPAALPRWVIPSFFALDFALLLSFIFLVLSYQPSRVYDVLLITKDGLPLASRLERFASDEFLVSGFFTALSSVDRELSDGKERVSVIKRGNEEILVEEGVKTRLIALVDHAHPALRNMILSEYRDFEIGIANVDLSEILSKGEDFASALEFVNRINAKKVRFEIPQPIRWSIALSMVVGPLMVLLNGLI